MRRRDRLNESAAPGALWAPPRRLEPWHADRTAHRLAMAEAISADEPIEAIALNRGPIERAQAPVRARALRRVGPRPPLEHVDGPDARIAEVFRAVAERIASRPLTSAMLAIGVGFVVGGALSFRAGRVALAAAGRHILRELLKQVL